MSEKTEEPTDKKLEDARKKGQSPKSPDATAALSLVGMMFLLIGMSAGLVEAAYAVLQLGLQQGMAASGNDEMLAIVAEQIRIALLAVTPLLLASVVFGLLGMFAQVGLNISLEPVAPKFEKVDPAAGLKRLLSPKTLIEVAKAVVKAIVLGWVIWVIVRDLIPLMVGAAYLPVAGVGVVAWSAVLKLLGAACLVFVLVGPCDYALQMFFFMREQRMSKDDIKREHKDSEGDPHLKGHLSALRHEFASEDPKQHVPAASVVITNPTHYAVAIRYHAVDSPLPVVVAKGMDEEATYIRALATDHGIPMVGNPPLARALHKLPLNQPIPEELFEAVAGVLRWVAELNAMSRAQR